MPSLHRKYLSTMVDTVFSRCTERLVEKLSSAAQQDLSVNMEEKFSQLTLDVIGLSVFNYNFDSLTTNSPVIQAVYTALKETESRSTDIFPYWKVWKWLRIFRCTINYVHEYLRRELFFILTTNKLWIMNVKIIPIIISVIFDLVSFWLAQSFRHE